MTSGVAVHDDVVSRYNEMKLGHKFRYLVFRLSDNNEEIIVEKTGGTVETYENFVEALPRDDCRYAVYDFEFILKDGGQRNKLVFFVWAPDCAKIKKKMLVASSKDAVRKKLVGIHTEVQATDIDEVDYHTVLEKVSRGEA